jgi:hypothetical protein
MSYMFKFTYLANAISFVDHATKPCRIIMGDNLQYWVVTPRHAELLMSQGFEVAD